MASGYVYLAECAGRFKIGRSRNPKKREAALNGGPDKVRIIHVIETNNSVLTEQIFHHRYASKRLSGEWFSLSSSEVGEIMSVDHMGVREGEFRETVTRRISEVLWNRFQQYVSSLDPPVSDRDVLETAIEQYLDHHEPKTKREGR